MSKTIAIIPARGGSKRLPKKNIKMLGQLPLLAYSIIYAKKHDFIDEVIVSTDCPDIKNTALKYGAKVIDRPLQLSGDYEPTVTALAHVLDNLDYKVDQVILLQATNPLRPFELLNEAFQKFKECKCSSLFTVTRDHHKLGKINMERFIPFNYIPGQRSQDLEPLFYENGLLYITKADLIKENEIISKDAIPFIVAHPFTQVDIDTQDDFDYAEYLIEKHKYRL